MHDYAYGTLQLSENHLQPQVVLQYKFAEENMFYAKYVNHIQGMDVKIYDISGERPLPPL